MKAKSPRCLGLVAFVAILALSVSAHAGSLFNANTLYNWCSSTAETSQIACAIYVAGVADSGFIAAAMKSPEARVLANQSGMGQLGPASWCFYSDQITTR